MLSEPAKYLQEQGNKVLLKFAEAADHMAERFGMGHLNPWNLTLEAHSYDGTHYTRTVNVMMAQILFNQWNK